MYNIVIFGMSGAGKGAQAKLLGSRFGIPHITTGDILRDHVARQTELGKKVKKIMDAGKWVPDKLIIELVKDRLSRPDARKGYILDGTPRTLAQAEALDRITRVDRVIFLRISEDTAVGRLSGRSQCINGHIYGTANPAKIKGKCDICGLALKVRSDETPQAMRSRIGSFHDSAVPVLDYYRKQGKLAEINGEQGIGSVNKEILKHIE